MNYSPPITFHGADQYFRESECGTYRVVKVIIAGVPRYEAWRRERDWQRIAVNLATPEEAREACQLVRDQSTAPAVA